KRQGRYEGGVAQFDGRPQDPVQGNEYRQLYHHGQAAGHGVDLEGPVQAHQLLVHSLLVVFVFLPDLGHLGLELLHRLHGLVAFVVGVEEEDADHKGEDDDGPAVIKGIALKKPQGGEQGVAQEIEPAEVDGPLQAQDVKVLQVLGPEIKTI